ncbi:hypothetical protein IF650_02505 [Cellulosimicrobium terreum]|nr:hypothetical protein [Cellulosimicrobium terreum]
MTDPIVRLRAEHRARPGDPFDADLDFDAVRAEIHTRTAGERPGGQTRRRRTLLASAVGAVGAGVVVAGALVVPGLLPDDGPPPAVAGSPTAHPRDGIVGSAPEGDGIVGSAPEGDGPVVVSAASYVQRARTAVDEVDLTAFVVEHASTFGVQHPGEPELDTSVTRQLTAGDGSGMRWISEKDFAASSTTATTGDEEVHVVDPAGPEGQMTYTWVSPRAGVWTQFTMPPETWDDIEEGTGQEQLASWIEELGSSMEEIEELSTHPDVTTSGPVAETVRGQAATCFDLSGTGAPAGGADPVEQETIDWTRTACFDDATHLPLSDSRSSHYEVAEGSEPSLLVTSDEYTWHALDDASRALLQPDLDGLREVSKDEYDRLTS